MSLPDQRRAAPEVPAWPRWVGLGTVLAVALLVVIPRLFDTYRPFPPAGDPPPALAFSSEPGERLFVGWALPDVLGDRDVVLEAVTLSRVDPGIELVNVWALRYDEGALGALEVATPATIAEHYSLHLLDEVTLRPGAREWYLAFELQLTEPGEASAGPVALRWRAGDDAGEYVDPVTYTLAGGFAELADGRTCGRPDLDLRLTVTGDALEIDLVPTGEPCAVDTRVELAVLTGQFFVEMEGNPAEGFEHRGVVDDRPDLVADVELPCGTGALELVVIVQDADGLVLAEAVQSYDAPVCGDGEEPRGRLSQPRLL